MTTAGGLRSYLYVPGDSGRRLEQAEQRCADAVIADLEDSVTAARKTDALKDVLGWLNSDRIEQHSGVRLAERWVRINAGASGLEELDELVHDQLSGVVLPKISSAEDLAAANIVVTAAEQRLGLEPGTIAFMPLIETADAVVNILAIARAARVIILQLGEVDLAADLGFEPDIDDGQFAAIRSAVVVASQANGLGPPVGPVSTNYLDIPSFRLSTERLRRMGFMGRVAIHPAQLPIIHEVYTPTATQVDSAKALIRSAHLFTAAGRGAWVGADGTMIDEAVLRRARRVLDSAQITEDERKW